MTDRSGEIVTQLRVLEKNGERAERTVAQSRTNTEADAWQALVALPFGIGQSGQIAVEPQLGQGFEITHADLVVVRGDPLANLQAMRNVEWVFQAGFGRRPCDIVMPTMDETAESNALGLL